MNQDFMQNWLQLWANPLFTQRFDEFFASMQQFGMEAARKSWAANYRGDSLYGNAADLFEPMIAFYSNMGFVPKKQHDEVLAENEQLKRENEFLKKTLRELNLKVLSEGSVQMQQVWQETARKQMEMGAEIAKDFLEVFKQQAEE
jgi:regulator of replication initiation timing